MNKMDKALEACEKVIEGIEDQKISTSSVLLLCSKIARLLNDEEAMVCFQYENGGYPVELDGHFSKKTCKYAEKMGRKFTKDGSFLYFKELAPELEQAIEINKKAVSNFTTSGTSVSGEYALLSIDRLTTRVNNSTVQLIGDTKTKQRRLSILRTKYYEYALKKQIELLFSNVVKDVFSEYKENVDIHFSELSRETLFKLQAIENKVNTDNPELYSQAITTCRRLFSDVSNELFEKYYPNYSEKKYKTKSGKEIDVTGDHYKNKLSAVIEKLESKSLNKTLVGSNVIYLLDWIDKLCEEQCKGVHSEISLSDAKRCILQTYMCLGDILILQDKEG